MRLPFLLPILALIAGCAQDAGPATRRFNPPDVWTPEIPGIGKLYSQVIRTSSKHLVVLAGTAGVDAKGALAPDMGAQVRLTMQNIDRSLAAAGGNIGDVVRTSIYTTDVDRYMKEGHSEMMKAFGDKQPTSTLIGVTRLALPNQLVEVEALAALN